MHYPAIAWSIVCCSKKLNHALKTSARCSRSPGKHLTLVSPAAWEQYQCRQQQCSCIWYPAMLWCTFVNDLHPREKPDFFKWLCSSCLHTPKAKSSRSPGVPKMFLKMPLFCSQWSVHLVIQNILKQILMLWLIFNSFCRFLLSYLTQSKYLQKGTAKSDYTILGENIRFLLSTTTSEDA